MNDNSVIKNLPASIKDQLVSALVVALLLSNAIGGSGVFRSGKFTDADAAAMASAIKEDLNAKISEMRHEQKQIQKDIISINQHLAALPPPAWQKRIRELEHYMYRHGDNNGAR